MKKMMLLIVVVLLSVMAACHMDSKPMAPFDTISTDLSADEMLAIVKGMNVVVSEGATCTHGNEIWDAFYRASMDGKAGSVMFAEYYTLDKDRVSEELYEAEKDLYPKIYFGELSFDGNKYSVTVRDGNETEFDIQRKYKYLMKYTGDAPKSAAYQHYEYYVLVHDDTVTWDDIWNGMISSQSGDNIDHYSVFQKRW